MIQSLDPVGPGPRVDPASVLGRGPVVDAEQARTLGLRNGQVIQAVIDPGGSTFSVLWPAGQRFGLPTALQAFPLPSQWRWAAGSTQEMLALLMPGGHIMLKPLKPALTGPAGAPSASAGPLAQGTGANTQTGGSTAATPGVGMPSSRPEPLPPYTLGQAFAAAQGAGAASGASSAELARLLQQAPAWAALMRLLQAMISSPKDDDASRDAAASGDKPWEPVALPRGLLPQMGRLSSAELQQALARSGLGTEAALLAGSLQIEQDLKVILRRMLRQGGATTGGSAEASLARAVDTLERSQIDSLAAQMQGQVLLACVIPFGDAGPVALRISRQRVSDEEEPPPFVVDVHSPHSGLGPLWLRTQVARDQSVSLTMWALRTEVAEQARGRATELRAELLDNGMTLSHFRVVAGAPQEEDVGFSPAQDRP